MSENCALSTSLPHMGSRIHPNPNRSLISGKNLFCMICLHKFCGARPAVCFRFILSHFSRLVKRDGKIMPKRRRRQNRGASRAVSHEKPARTDFLHFLILIHLRCPFGAMQLRQKMNPLTAGLSYFLNLLARILDICLSCRKSRDVKERFAPANRSFSART